ncbi:MULTISPECIES: thermonuclease family protein [Parvibaculum]|uniref:thermonuclease family protein n=1 Tax=Parvibaculum TaxID=256616 RepID=UPI00141FC655|nr:MULTISPECIES: thermonuclease family protein [Parvibaculum]NIJ41558.1 endonuclease YncB(thermonuclease family) [Parvibaculum indicum]
MARIFQFRSRPRRRFIGLFRRRNAGFAVGLLIIGAIALYQQTSTSGAPSGAATPVSASEITSIYDGDTFRMGAERVRILGVDAPELGTRAKCAAEREAAIKARDYLRRKLRGGAVVTIERNGNDVYERTLARVFVDGHDIADDMISIGLAIPYSPSTHGKWCDIVRK